MPYQGQVKSRDARTLGAVKTTIQPSLTGLILDVRGFSKFGIRVPAAITTGAASPQTAAPLAAPVQTAATANATGGTIAAGTVYFYKITALNAAGESVGSNEIAVTAAAGAGVNSNVINWTAVTGATGYRIYRGTASNAESAYQAVGAVTTFTDTGAAGTAGTPPVAAAPAAPVLSTVTTSTTGGALAAGTYYYKVSALNASGESIGSNEISVVATGLGSSNTVTWAAVAGATSYRVYRGTAAGAENVYYAVGAFTSYIDTGAAPAAPSVSVYRVDQPMPVLGTAPTPLPGAQNLYGTYAAASVTILTVDWPFIQVVPTGAPVDVFTIG